MTDLHKLLIVVDVYDNVPQVILEHFRAAGDRIGVFGVQIKADGTADGKILLQGPLRVLVGFQGYIVLTAVEKVASPMEII